MFSVPVACIGTAAAPQGPLQLLAAYSPGRGSCFAALTCVGEVPKNYAEQRQKHSAGHAAYDTQQHQQVVQAISRAAAET